MESLLKDSFLRIFFSDSKKFDILVYKITRSYTFLVKNIVNLAFYCARAPKFFIELFLNQMGKEILLKGQYATPEKLINLGFKFEYNNLEDFLNR